MKLTPEIVEIVKALVTWLLVILGWMVVSEQQSRRELGKIHAGRIYALREKVKEIESSAMKFHTSAFDQTGLRSLLRMISELGIEASHIRDSNSLPPELSYRVAKFRQAVTLKNFDRSSHIALDPDSEILLDIVSEKDLLDRQLLQTSQKVATQQPSLIASLSSATKRIF